LLPGPLSLAGILRGPQGGPPKDIYAAATERFGSLGDATPRGCGSREPSRSHREIAVFSR
jgi:hypothetical protein